MFVDEVTIRIQAGKGGDGMSSFRREKYVNKGGPDGGDGGNGGDVLVRADTNVDTLSELRYSQTITAEDGQAGKKSRAHGKSGNNREITVPVGTVVYEGESVVADLSAPGASAVIAKGGRGGFGNAHFTSSTRQAPRMAELGEAGEEKDVRFELKTVADVGLVGLPNAGKSTLLSVISNAKPKIADYPFTTLTPSLGVADIYESTLVVADIPGLIEGASQGRGLGDDFLRHIERTKVLLHLLDSTQEELAQAYETVCGELANFQADLTKKPQLIALTKTDAVDQETIELHKQDLQERAGIDPGDVFTISSVAHDGLDEVLQALLERVNTQEETEEAFEEGQAEAMPTITLENDPQAWWVQQEKGRFIIHGQKIGKFAERTDFSDYEALRRLRDILHKWGIDRELERRGVRSGDEIAVGGKTFEW